MTDNEDEQSFKQMWKEARIRFEETTNRSLVQSNNRSLDDVLKELDQRFNSSAPNEGSKQQRIKELATNVLKFIQVLGGIAAQGASAVFGPASMCFNAMQYLIDIPAKISKFYDDLALLFEELSTFMKQFKIYQRIEQFTKVDIELKQSTHKLMIAFVDICAITIDVFSGSRLRKFKINAKIALFDNDSGIETKLDEFRRLIDHQSQISDAVTLEHVLKTEVQLTSSMKTVLEMLNKAAEDSRQLLEAKAEEIQDELKDTHDDVRAVKAGTEVLVNDSIDRNSTKRYQEYLDHISRKLPEASETIQKLEKEFDQIRSDSLPKTGLWLEDIDIYKQWTDLDSKAGSLLLVSGSNGCGKSFLAYAILDYVKSRQSIADNSSIRVSLAYYRFMKTEKPSREVAIKDALKSIAVQLAKRNLVYRKNLHKHLESKDLSFLRDTSVQDLLKELVPPPNMRDNEEAYVLLFDGLDQLSADDATQFFAAVLAMESAKLRILVSGTEEALHSCINSLGKSSDSIPIIRVVEHNEADIKRFIDSELKACKALQGEAREIRRIKDSIREKLPEIVEGNFNDVRQIIERVSEAVESENSVEDITSLISVDTLKDKDAATERLVNDLNESLNVQEIEQLNELLIWTIYAFEYMSVDEMRAALFLRTKRTPLQSLEDKVARKYSKLLLIDTDNNNFFKMKSTYLEDFFRNSTREKQEIDTDGVNDPKISMTITIDHVKLSKVQRFFWDLSEKVVLDKFAFSNSLTSPGHTVTVRANKTEAHLALTKRCFDLLLDERVEETKILCDYALINLPKHLHFLRGEIANNLLESAERIKIVDDLVSLLQFADCIERNLNERFLQQGCWLDQEYELQAIQLWLCDSEAMDRLNRRGLSWLKQVHSAGTISALKDIATMIARHWLCLRTWSAELPFQWIDMYLNQLARDQVQAERAGEPGSGSGEEAPGQEDGDKNSLRGEPASEVIPIGARILRASEWASSEGKIPKDSLWYERLGNTYLYYEATDLAKEAFLSAKELPGCFWKVSERLAEAYAMSNQKDLAVQEMEVVFADLRSKEGLTLDEKVELVEGLNKTAKWQTELKNTTDAIHMFWEAIHLDERHYRSYYELLNVFVITEQKTEATKLLSDMGAHTLEDDSQTQLGSMLLDFSSWGFSFDYFCTVFDAIFDKDLSQVILRTVQGALTSARDSKTTRNVVDLLLWQGVGLALYGTEENRLESALERWRECYTLGFQSAESENWLSALYAARHVFGYLYSQVRSGRSSTSDVESYQRELEQLADSPSSAYAAQHLRLPLASFYRLLDKQDAGQKLLLNDMKSGIDLLSDADPENDYLGYQTMANVLMHTGDDLNALSAWSLYGPPERYKEVDATTSDQAEKPDAQEEASPLETEAPAKLGYTCDGGCNITMTYADSIWFCKVCDDFQFHDECLKKLRAGTLNRYACSPDHEWLRVPSWIDEYRATGKGRVRIGGELQDGKRVGGTIVPVEEWLDMIREKWGIEKPAPEVQPEGEEQKDTAET